MLYKKLLLTTKLPDEKILEIFLPYLIKEIEFEDRKDNDITLFLILDTQNISKECLINIIKKMKENNCISNKTIEYIVNKYTNYNLSINDFI